MSLRIILFNFINEFLLFFSFFFFFFQRRHRLFAVAARVRAIRLGASREGNEKIKESNGRETGIINEGIDWPSWSRANERKITGESL